MAKQSDRVIDARALVPRVGTQESKRIVEHLLRDGGDTSTFARIGTDAIESAIGELER